jgi:hypothetical protein
MIREIDDYLFRNELMLKLWRQALESEERRELEITKCLS